MAWTVIAAPSAEPVTLAEAKAHLRIDHELEDALIGQLIAAARQHIELTCNRALMPQQWAITRGTFPRGALGVPGGCVRSVESVTYTAPDGDRQTLAPSSYELIAGEPARLVPLSPWPATVRRPGAVTITANVGYPDAESVPAPLKQAMLLLVAHWYDHRAAVVLGTHAAPLPMAVDALIFPYRDMSIL